MITLNLATKDSQQERFKNYLQENVSESLADKINNGVRITKDGKPYISKKDLDGFFEYACKTAQEQSEKGKRSALKHSRVMIHQPMGGMRGQASDMEINYKQIMLLRDELYQIISDHSGQPFEKIMKDSDRDYWMTSAEAKEYGMIDKVLIKEK